MSRQQPADGDTAAGPADGDTAAGTVLLGGLLATEGFEPVEHPTDSTDPLGWPGYRDQVAAAAGRTGRGQSVLTGTGSVGGHRCVLVAFDFAFLGGSVGLVESAAIAAAFETAVRESLPVVSLVSTGGTRIQEGTSALVGMRRIATAVAAARRSAIPHVSVVRHPTTGGMWASLAAGADVVVALQGAAVSFAGSRLRSGGKAAERVAEFTSEGKWRDGFADALCSPAEVPALVGQLLELLSPASRGPGRQVPPPPAPGPRPAASLGWAQVQRARGPERPRWAQYLAGYLDFAVAIRGDRCGGVDDAVRCGFGRHGDQTIAYVAQTGAPTSAAGFRTAQRLLRLAERLRLPVLCLVDTPGAAAGSSDEAAGIGTAIAELLIEVAGCTVPVTSLIIGEGGSGGALALTVEGSTWIAPDGYLAVTAPEYAAAILKRPVTDAALVADRLGLAPADLARLGLARPVDVAEPLNVGPTRTRVRG